MYIYTCPHTYTHTHIYTHAYKMYIWTHGKHVWKSDCAGSLTWHQEALPFSLSASRQRAVQTTSAYLHWCGPDPPSSLSTPAPSLAVAPRNEVIFLSFWRVMIAKNCTRRLCAECNRIFLREALLYNPSHDSAWPTLKSKQQTWTKQSLSQRYVCVGCELNSDQALKLLCKKRRRQSAWLDAVTTPLTRSCVL